MSNLIDTMHSLPMGRLGRDVAALHFGSPVPLFYKNQSREIKRHQRDVAALHFGAKLWFSTTRRRHECWRVKSVSLFHLCPAFASGFYFSIFYFSFLYAYYLVVD
jgi:hypothetical protein